MKNFTKVKYIKRYKKILYKKIIKKKYILNSAYNAKKKEFHCDYKRAVQLKYELCLTA